MQVYYVKIKENIRLCTHIGKHTRHQCNMLEVLYYESVHPVWQYLEVSLWRSVYHMQPPDTCYICAGHHMLYGDGRSHSYTAPYLQLKIPG